MCTVSSKKGKLYDLTLPVLYLAQIKIVWFNVTNTQELACVGDQFWLLLM